MNIWPESGTLTEAGDAAAASMSNMSGFGGGPGGGAPGMGAMNAGEILLNRAESAALAALETEDDEAHAMKRARAESGLETYQIERLKRRAQTAISKGYTLKGQGFVKKPTPSAPDEPGLTRKAQRGKDVEEEPASKAKAAATTKETASLVRSFTGAALYTCPDMDSYGFPQPNSESGPEPREGQRESNSITTLTSMLRRNRRKREY